MLSVHAVSCCTSSSPVHAGDLEHMSIGYSIFTRIDYIGPYVVIAGILSGCYGGNLASLAVNFRRPIMIQ